LELDGRELDERLLVLRLLRVEREPEDGAFDAGALRVGSSLPSRDEDCERVERVRVLGGGFELLLELPSLERRLGRRPSSGGAARRTGVSQ
jgi:hypothetical protein